MTLAKWDFIAETLSIRQQFLPYLQNLTADDTMQYQIILVQTSNLQDGQLAQVEGNLNIGSFREFE